MSRGSPYLSMGFAHYAPKVWCSLVFELKFVIGLGIAGVSTLLEGALYDITGGFYWLFVVLATVATVISLILPGRIQSKAAPAAE